MVWVRILGFVVVALGGLLSLSQCQVKSLKSDKAETEQQLFRSQSDLTTAIEINRNNAAVIDRLNGSLALQETLAREQINRARLLTAELNRAQKLLQEKARYDKKLREYLASNIYYTVVEWLWFLPSEGGDREKGADMGIAPREFAPGDSQTGIAIPVVTHQKGWQWAKATDRALNDCNADKAALRKWVTYQKDMRPIVEQKSEN